MKISNLTGFLLLAAIIGSCIDDGDLHRTIFIRDKNHPDLPQYSEWGYNTFGSYINEDVFASGDYFWDPASVSSTDTSLILTFHGEKRTKEKDTTDMTISFSIPGQSPRNGQYLLELNDVAIDLAASSVHVLITYDQAAYPVVIESGELFFKRVQNLVVDNNPQETILSGTFEFEGTMNGNPVSVTLGRFDVGINYYYN